MIITTDELISRLQGVPALPSVDVMARELASIEETIRAYTNNKFQMQAARFSGLSDGASVVGTPRYMSAGDTVEISQSKVNDGLYTISAVDSEHIELADVVGQPAELYPAKCLVTKIKYPADVVQIAVDLYRWKCLNGDKVGIKSETLSRHAVTYEDSATLYHGYPVGILSGLKLYRKARC